QRFHRRTHLQAAVERDHFRRRLLRRVLETVGAAVVGVKTRMPLKDEIALPGKPPRQRFRVLKDGILPAVVIELGVRLRSERDERNQQEQSSQTKRSGERATHTQCLYRKGGHGPPFHFTPVQDRSLLRVAELQQLLAEVRSREQADDRLGRVLESVLQINLVLDFAFGEPPRHFGDRLGIARGEMKYQEAFHPRMEQ